MEERKYCVYKHTSPSGKVYIGITKQTTNERWKNGLGYQTSPHFWNAIQKYGWANFTHEVLMSGLSVEDACAEEQRFIKEFNATDRAFGYNEKAGGQRGSSLNAEVRKRISEANKAFYKKHPEIIQKISDSNRGYRHTDEAKRKMSEAAKHRHYKLSDEWKQRIGKANRERIFSDAELYEDICNRCRENGRKVAKPVVQLDADGNEIARFENAHDAERKTGISNGNIARCCRGSIKSAGGYKWQYAISYNGGRETA